MFRITSIKIKARFAFFLVSLTVLFFSFITFLIFEYQNFRLNTLTNVKNLAHTVTLSNSAAIELSILQPIQLDLYNTLSRYEEIKFFCLYDTNGKALSTFSREILQSYLANRSELERLILDSALVSHQIPIFKESGEDFNWTQGELHQYVSVESQSGKKIGVVYVVRDLRDFYQRFKRLALVATLVISVSSILAIILSFVAEKLITRPILELEQLAQKIMLSSDYSLRIHLSDRNDEIGSLMQALDRLLEHIQLQNQSLLASKEKAEELANVKQNFLATMSHEIRTPMNAVMGMAGLLQETDLTATQRKYVDIILNSTDSLLVIINDILDFSKIESGSLVFELIPMNIREQIENIIESYRPKFEAKKLSVVQEFKPDVPTWILADPVRFSQVIINLFTNAIKFTEKGSIVIGARLLASDKRTSLIRFFVKDTGIGIPKEKHEDVFKLFTQASSTTTRKYGGTGLGLSISKQLVEMQNGRIYLESEEGKGSEFGFEIWFENCLPESYREKIDPKVELNPRGKKILLAEDNDVNQLLVVTLLNQWGFEVDVAINGRQVVEKAKSGEYSLILMDVHMPEIDGYQASRVLRKELGLQVPILAITASAMKGEAERCLEAGMNDLIPKPFRKQELKEKIFSFLA